MTLNLMHTIVDVSANSVKKNRLASGSFALANRDDIRQSLDSLAGPALLSCVPRRRQTRVFNWILQNYVARQERRQDIPRGVYADRIRAILGEDISDTRVREIVHDFFVHRQEDRWARWQAIRSPNWTVNSEIEGLQHLRAAQEQGRGAILWGISFCGTLFPKIALANAGVALAQLSSLWHGMSDPNTLLAKKVVGPLYRLAENRYLRERIVIPLDGSTGYVQRIGEVLGSNGSVWMAGDGSVKHRAIEVEMFGRRAKFPAGPPMLSMRYDAALIPAYAQRMGQFNYKLTLHEPITFDSNLRRPARITSAVQTYANILEANLREQPGGWDWEIVPGALGTGNTRV